LEHGFLPYHLDSASDCAFAMAGVKEAADILVVSFDLVAEHGVDLVVEDGRQAVRVAHLAEQVRRAHVHGEDRARDQQVGHLERAALAALRLR